MLPNLVKGEYRDNCACANWHGRAALNAPRRGANLVNRRENCVLEEVDEGLEEGKRKTMRYGKIEKCHLLTSFGYIFEKSLRKLYVWNFYRRKRWAGL